MSRLIYHGARVLRGIAKKADGVVGRIAHAIADKAQENAPVKTGTLKRSIQATDTSVEVGVDYAAAVEFGTATKAAQPYLRPGIEQFDTLKQCIK